MLLRHRSPGIESPAINTTPGFEHLEDDWIAVLHWLQANRIDYVLVGPAAAAIRGDRNATGPVMIMLAPYGRNHERLARALFSAHARLRVDGDTADLMQRGAPGTVPVKLSAEKLGSGTRWALRCGLYDLDVEGLIPGIPRYQELLYEAGRFELAPGFSVEVASPEDLEHHAHARRTGEAPEIRITRNSP